MSRRGHFEVRPSRDRQWYIVFIAGNGREVWRSSKTYIHRAGAINAFHVLERAFADHFGDRHIEVRQP